MFSLALLWLGGVMIGVGGTMVYMSSCTIDSRTIRELLMCLNGAVYCMTHDVMGTTRDFELRHIKTAISELEGRQ